MRYYLLTTLLIFVKFCATSQFTDDFTDGDFIANPTWSGEDANFEVDVSNRLHLNAPAVADTSYLSTLSNSINNAVWEFYVELDFNPSSSNLARVYLVSDVGNLEGSLSGYFVMIGNTADEVSLYRQDGTSTTKIIDGVDGAVNVALVTVRVQVTRDATGNWELLIDNTGGTAFTSQGTAFDDTYISSTFFGVHCKYTSTRSDKFYFDDFSVTGTGFVDTTPPDVVSVTATSATQVDVVFTEPVDQTTAETVINYSIDNGIGSPSTATRDGVDFTLVHLTLATTLSNGASYDLSTSNVEDLASNAMATSVDPFTYFIPATPSYKDVLINEIFADPSPQIGLPAEEYVEIYNVSANYFNLNGWTFSDGTATATIGNEVMAPGEYIILCSEADTALFSSFGRTIGVSSFPSLNNAGDPLELTDGSTIIDEVTYSDEWYRDPIKDDGGYSLELINPTIPCADAANWTASNDPSGGTPGQQNSVYDNTPDTTPPSVISGVAVGLDSVQIQFSESLDQAALGSIIILFSNGLGYTESLDANDPSILWISVNPSMTPGAAFTITISGLTDCAGNSMTQTDVEILVPEDADPGDLIVNEILFNPMEGGSDFVEVYNNSDKYISLEGWMLANYDNDTIDNFQLVADETVIIAPGEYKVLTRDSIDVKTDYPLSAIGSFVQMATLPSYNNEAGTVYLITPNNEVSDEKYYHEDMHFALLNSVDGVSLERIDFNRPSGDETNWHSAAENVGFATPGYQNSQFAPAGTPSGSITIDPEVFSPDNDGYQDVVNITYTFNNPGFVGTIAIYDAHGRLIKWITRNELFGTEGTVSWDGTTESNSKAQMGIYVVFVEVFNLNGEVERFKETVVLGGRL